MHDRYAIYNADCMEVMPNLKPESIGFSVYSPPFPELYQYSNDPRDMSNCTKYEEGMAQYQFVVKEIARLTKPGRMTAVHCMDLKKGSYFQRDFPGDIVKAHEAEGFHFFCRITIWKDPWLIARRTRVRSLMHKSLVKGGHKVRVAGPDYVLVFVKGGEDKEPITHEHGLKKYAGETAVPPELLRKYLRFTGDQRKNLLSHWIWRQYASPVWMDIRSGRLLPYEEAKENEEEKHVCPLQIDVIERCLTLWSNPGDVVLTPFMGIGSEVYTAVANGRNALGIELKTSYFNQARKNIKAALLPQDEQDDLFTETEITQDQDEDEEEIEEPELVEAE